MKPKKDREMLGVLRRTKRSGAYVPNSTGTGIVKAGKEMQKMHKTKMKSAIKALKRGL